MERKAELRLPTIAVPVKLTLIARKVLPAELFVADAARTNRSQLIDDLAAMLDEPASFVPVRSGGTVHLYAKHAISWIDIRREDDDGDDDNPSEVITLYDRQHRVEIELATGERLVGSFFDSSPSDRPRVVDHLNRAARFVRLWTPADHYLINKDQILHVSEQE